MFVEAHRGYHFGSVDLENCFHILCAVWDSDRSLFAGGSNGVVYEIILNARAVSDTLC
jgi:hypothetical protein